VNLNDFNILASNFGQSGTTFSQADFSYDGITNLDDFNILAGKFGAALASTFHNTRSPQDGSIAHSSPKSHGRSLGCGRDALR
jgi:hypothetical protein